MDLRREDLAMRELTKIMAKENNQKVAECFQNWQVKIEEQHEKYLSPFGMAFMQLNDTISIPSRSSTIKTETRVLE